MGGGFWSTNARQIESALIGEFGSRSSPPISDVSDCGLETQSMMSRR
jgi:hypothetical protein